MTPPERASQVDDGYLSASEIAGLKLDADWVILSACNTAAGETNGAEALSGLARAFFYAGTRSLLVSHWAAVNSDATVKLIIKAVAELKGDSKIGHAEALRRSMLAMIDSEKTTRRIQRSGHRSCSSARVELHDRRNVCCRGREQTQRSRHRWTPGSIASPRPRRWAAMV